MKDLLGIPGLKAQRRARQQSEVWAMTHFVD